MSITTRSNWLGILKSSVVDPLKVAMLNWECERYHQRIILKEEI